MYTKDSMLVKQALVVMKANGNKIKDIPKYIPDHRNIREVVEQCMLESKDS